MNAVFILVALSLGQATPAPKVRAGALLDQGNLAFKSGDFKAALALYEDAYAAFASPKIKLNIAQALVELGRGPEAARAYDETLVGLDAESSLRPVAAQARQELIDELVLLTVSSTPTATLFIDESRTSPVDVIYLAPGEHALRLEASGHVTWQQMSKLPAGRQDISVRLEPLVALAEPEEEQGNNTVWWVAGGVAAAVVIGVIAGVAVSSAGDSTELGVTALSDWQRQ